MCTNPVCPLANRLGVINVGASEDHVRHGYKQCFFINGFKQAFGGHVNSVIGWDHMNTGAAGSLRFPKIHDRWKVEVAVHDLIAFGVELETRSNNRLTLGYIAVQ